jgi:hypothetical protein
MNKLQTLINELTINGAFDNCESENEIIDVLIDEMDANEYDVDDIQKAVYLVNVYLEGEE